MAQVGAVVNVDIGYKPRLWQTAVHRKLKRFSVLVVHRRAGKTVMTLAELIDKGLKCPLKMGRFAYIAPLRNQAKGIVWSYLKDFTRDIPGLKSNEAELYVEFPNGARITLYGADNPDAIRGAYLDGVVLDEYADIGTEVWTKVLRPMLADRLGWAIVIGTPKGHNHFFEIYRKAMTRMAEGKDWYAVSLPYWETDALDKDEIEAAHEEMGDTAFAQEFCVDFSVEGADVLIPIKLVEEAMARHVDEVDFRRSAKVMGVDVARFGDDSSVIQKRQGLYAESPITLKGLDNMELANRVAAEINLYEPDAVFVDAGRGEGVIDRLRELGYAVIEVNFGGKSVDDKCRNHATLMWVKILQWLKSGGSLDPDTTVYLTELSARTYKFGPDGRMIIEPKDALKKRFKSPDHADALALTFAHDVEPNIDYLHDHVPNSGQALSDYDPW